MWLSFEEIEALGVSERHIRRLVKSAEWKSRDTGLRGRNGKPVREVLLETLPHELQLKWIQMNQPETPEIETSERSLTDESIEIERRLTESLLRYKPDVREAFRNEAVRLQDIVNRYSIINPKREKRDGKHEFVSAVWQLCREAVCSDPIVLSVEPKRGKTVSPFTLDGWWRSSQSEGLCAFLRKPSVQTKPADKIFMKLSAQICRICPIRVRNHFPTAFLSVPKNTFLTARIVFA